MECYRKIQSISYKDHVPNEEVCAKIQQAIGPHEKLLTIVKRRKLQWYGHFSRSSGLAKTIFQGTVKGRRRQGRQKKRWKDNIREWTGPELARSQRAVENREKWRKLVVKWSLVPQRTPAVKAEGKVRANPLWKGNERKHGKGPFYPRGKWFRLKSRCPPLRTSRKNIMIREKELCAECALRSGLRTR